MSNDKETPTPGDRDKLQDLVPPGREKIYPGQQFDEKQRQHKNPDNSGRPEDPRQDHS